MNNHDNRFDGQRPNQQTRSYDSRTYYSGEGHGQRDYTPGNRGSYERGDMETHWDQYNAAHYGGYNSQPASYGSGADGRYWLNDRRMHSGNREWHLNDSPNPGRNEYSDNRYSYGQRYTNHDNDSRHRDVFEWVGEGVTRMSDSVAQRDRHPADHDRDRDYHRSYQNEQRSYGVSEENLRAYGNRNLRGYERGHSFADDTPERQQHIGDRTWPEGNNQEADFHRAGRHFDRYRNL